MKTFRCKLAKNLIISHYNVNSIRHKFSELQHILQGHFVDILGIEETNIDDTFFDGQFQIDNHKLYRQDRNDRGGGIMMYINDNTPHRLLKQFSGLYHGIDFFTLEIIIKSRKWYICYLYRPPDVNELERVIFIIVYVYPWKCLLRHILSTRSHIGVWNIFLKTLSITMLILSPFTYVIYLTILMMSIGCMINYSCQYWIDMFPWKLRLWTNR